MLRLTLLRGPINEELLAAVATLYGRVDARYASVQFCRLVFNENPIGFSCHGFAFDGSRIVGHYAVIPVQIVAAGADRLSGKGEALYVEPEYRPRTIGEHDDEKPLGIALMVGVHDFAIRSGLNPICNITDAAVGMIQRMTGFTELRLRLDQSHVLFNAMAIRQLSDQWAARRAAALLAAGQRWLRGVAGPVAGRASQCSIESRPLDAALMQAMARSAPSSGWTVARSESNLRWFSRLGRLAAYAWSGLRDEFVIVATGRHAELIEWQSAIGGHMRGVAMLSAILDEAAHRGSSILSLSEAVRGRASTDLSFAARLCGFIRRPVGVSLYVKSDDPYFRYARHVSFNRLFNI